MGNALAWVSLFIIVFLGSYSTLMDYYKPKKEDKHYQLEPFSKEKGDFEL